MWAEREQESRESGHDRQHFVEANLNDLRDRHRLAMHVWEKYKLGDFPDFSWDAISATTRSQIDSQLCAGEGPLLSVSLLPSGKSGIAMKPFSIAANEISSLSYLIDMDQTQSEPPRVVQVSSSAMGSGWSVHNKKIQFSETSDIPELSGYYRQFATAQDARRAAGGENAKHHCELQMTALGQQYEKDGTPIRMRVNKDHVTVCNEMLVSVAKEHINAIAIPFFFAGRVSKIYEPGLRLLGAIAGLDHLDKGLEVPVVFYRVNGSSDISGPDCRQGDFLYLAQGREELAGVALDAIRTLQRLGQLSSYMGAEVETLKARVRERFHIDMDKPLDEQHEAIERLRHPPAAEVAVR